MKSLSTSCIYNSEHSIATCLEGGSKGERQLNKILINVYLYLYLYNTLVDQKSTGVFQKALKLKFYFAYTVKDGRKKNSSLQPSFPHGGRLPVDGDGSLIHILEFKNKAGAPFKTM